MPFGGQNYKQNTEKKGKLAKRGGIVQLAFWAVKISHEKRRIWRNRATSLGTSVYTCTVNNRILAMLCVYCPKKWSIGPAGML